MRGMTHQRVDNIMHIYDIQDDFGSWVSQPIVKKWFWAGTLNLNFHGLLKRQPAFEPH